MLADLTVKDFLDKVACSDPVPGGGSIAALNGALASSLSTMVARLTVGKKGYEVSEEVMQHAQTITLRLLDEFIALIDKDSAAYNEVFACFKLPKTTDEEKAARSAYPEGNQTSRPRSVGSSPQSTGYDVRYSRCCPSR